ncbi:AraC family transcriptional regulator [Sporolactobacillus sp. THM7-4]|nr:AraC family transcriptional regulator [Sporolactobacillus sp. THM7-4]
MMNNQRNFFCPTQPELILGRNDYKEFKPSSKNVALYYQFKTANHDQPSLPIIPDGCFDILICCNPVKPSAVFWSSTVKRSLKEQLNYYPNSVYFGIRLLPDQEVLTIKYSMKELIDKQIHLFDVLSLEPYVIESICTAETFIERVILFEDYIKYCYSRKYSPRQSVIYYLIRYIYDSKGMINLSDLYRNTGYSERYIRKKFEEYVGFSPKQFSQIVRFQNSIMRLLGDKDLNDFDIVDEYGYYDQAHFINDFKKFADLTPNQYKKCVTLRI